MTFRRSPLPVGAIVLVLLLALTLVATCYRGSEAVVTARVSSKERVCKDSGDSIECEYLVFTDRETLKVVDTLLYGRFNSSDVYGRIEDGRTYRFTVVGWRLPWASQYRNVVRVEEVPS